jgi:predicted DNA-binding transcriptional regulator AlpA
MATRKQYKPDPKFGYIDANDTAAMLGESLSALYKKTALGLIPHYKPNGRLLFRVEEIKDWIERSKN